jgi:hypothetical protein
MIKLLGGHLGDEEPQDEIRRSSRGLRRNDDQDTDRVRGTQPRRTHGFRAKKSATLEARRFTRGRNFEFADALLRAELPLSKPVADQPEAAIALITALHVVVLTVGAMKISPATVEARLLIILTLAKLPENGGLMLIARVNGARP